MCDLIYFPRNTYPIKELIDSLSYGIPVICDPEQEGNTEDKIVSEFEQYIFIGSLKEGIKWFENHPRELFEMIVNGQEYVKKEYAPERVARQWKEALIGL